MALRILVVILILAIPLELPGCGPFLPEAVFYAKRAPDSLDDFAHGHLGILQPTYDRLYQVIAYRHLAGIGLNDSERQALLPASPQPMTVAPAPTDTPNPWLEARNRVAGVRPLREIVPYRQVQKQGFYDTYLNCNDDAFRTAAFTLERVQKDGHAIEWIAAQDMVFSDCSTGAQIPPASSDPDRAYQVASAKFYSEQYDAARQDFQSIAGDASSPWQSVAPYLAARCLIRAGKFAEADAELQRIAQEPALARWRASANGLRAYLALRLRPAARMHELALALVKPGSQAAIGQDLIDYRTLFDRNVKPEPADDLTDWVLSFQANGQGALDKWRARQTLPWLVAALQSAGPHDTGIADLLSAAAAVPADSPAYLTVSFRRVQLLPAGEARAVADRVLAGSIAPAARNQFRAERMQLAQTFDDFLRYAARQPVAEVTEDISPMQAGEEYLDTDAADFFDYSLPLVLLRQASTSNLLPNRIRQDLQRAVATRALVLSGAPSFDEVFTLLHTPGARPVVDAGEGRYTKEPDHIDDFRDNWWCAPHEPPSLKTPFLTAAQQAQSRAELEKLRNAGPAPNWMAAQTLAFAQSHPQDPRVPEALYLVVRSTRFGCTDSNTGDFSERAFDLLHRRYPASEWTRKTPYWFK